MTTLTKSLIALDKAVSLVRADATVRTLHFCGPYNPHLWIVRVYDPDPPRKQDGKGEWIVWTWNDSAQGLGGGSYGGTEESSMKEFLRRVALYDQCYFN